MSVLKSAIEAVLFASGDPVTIERLALVLETSEEEILNAAAEMEKEFREQERGIRLVRLNKSLQLHTAPEFEMYIAHTLEQRRAPKLTKTSLEVLAVVAYYQPVTRAYIEQMRGSDSSYTIGVLQERGLIESCGQLDTIGRPTLYATTNLFLRTMGITDISQLPPLPELSQSDAARELQEKVDALKAADESRQLAEKMIEDNLNIDDTELDTVSDADSAINENNQNAMAEEIG